MTDFQITIQIVGTLVMAFSSFMMLVVSGFLAWNALKVRQLNRHNLDIAIWEKRYTVYCKIYDWHQDMREYLTNITTPNPQLNKIHSIKELQIDKTVHKLREGQFLFSDDTSIVQFFTGYVSHLIILPDTIDDVINKQSIIHTFENMESYYKANGVEVLQKMQSYLNVHTIM